MERLGDSFKGNKEFIVDFIQDYYGESLGDTEILPAVNYPNVSASAEQIDVGKLKMAVSKLVMKILENFHGAGIAGHNTVFYSQSLLGLTLSDTNTLQICAHEFGHILTERIVGIDWMTEGNYELLDGFADFVAYQVLESKYGKHFDWYGDKVNLTKFQNQIDEKGIKDGKGIIELIKNNAIEKKAA